MPRTLAIGDIHGCLTALDTLLGFVQPQPDDQLVFLGDYVDRGPDSKGVLNRLVELRRTGRVVCLRGNHEVMMAIAGDGREVRFWLACGGQEAMESYALPNGIWFIEDVPEEHWQFIREICVDWYETGTHIFVHANLHPELPLAKQTTDWLHWQALNSTWHKPYCSGKTMICGHTEQRSGNPLVLERAICIDTWAYGDGWLTCLDVNTGEYWQANEVGQTREAWLA
jgi:serine/threonine protein phosphatase 1